MFHTHLFFAIKTTKVLLFLAKLLAVHFLFFITLTDYKKDRVFGLIFLFRRKSQKKKENLHKIHFVENVYFVKVNTNFIFRVWAQLNEITISNSLYYHSQVRTVQHYYEISKERNKRMKLVHTYNILNVVVTHNTKPQTKWIYGAHHTLSLHRNVIIIGNNIIYLKVVMFVHT